MILRISLLIAILLSCFYSYSQELTELQVESVNDQEDNLDFVDKYLEEVQISPQENYRKFVTLRGLNKITARVSTIKSEINKKVTFGHLEILPKLCWKSSPEDAPENKVLLDIYEINSSSKKERIFYGWMFSSSPSISSLEHALYDITLVECSD